MTTLPPPSAAGRTKFGLPTRSLVFPLLRPSLATITPCPGSVARPAFVIAGALTADSASGSISGLSWVPELLAGVNGLPAASAVADFDFAAWLRAVLSDVTVVLELTCGPVGSASPIGDVASGM